MNKEELIQIIKQRKQFIGKMKDILINEKFVDYNNDHNFQFKDLLLEKRKIDADLFLKKLIVFGMSIIQSLEIRNNQEKVDAIYNYCKLFRDLNLIKISQKDEQKAIIQLALPEIRLKLFNDLQLIYSYTVFPQNISFKSVVSKICLIIDIIYNSFADSIYMGKDYLEKIEKSDQIIQGLILLPIQDYLDLIANVLHINIL